MYETNLKQVLKECNKSAKTGYKIASTHVESIVLLQKIAK